MNRVSAVLFDIGNVFVPWDPRFLYEKLIDNTQELEYFLQEVVTHTWHMEHDRGRPFAEGVEILSARFPEYADLIAAFDTRWNETLGPVITGTVDLLEELTVRGTPVYALTNFSAEKWPDFCRRHSFTDLFDGIVVSGEEKIMKPDPAIFHLVMNRFNLVAGETFFIDDRPENIRAAEKLGMQCHLFTDPEALRHDLMMRPFTVPGHSGFQRTT